MLEQYIREEQYEDLNEIQQKTILDRLNAEEYQGKPGIIPDVLENDINQDQIEDIALNNRIVIAADDGYVVIEYVGQNTENDTVNLKATPYFQPITIYKDDYTVTKPGTLLFEGVFGELL